MEFTIIALVTTALGLALGLQSHTWAVAACLLWGVAASFCCAPLLDATVYPRMRARRGWSWSLFHAGNVALHIAPLALTVAHPPTRATPVHGLAAAAVHTAWGRCVGGSHLCLDDVYVSMYTWMPLWCAAWASEMATGVVLYKILDNT